MEYSGTVPARFLSLIHPFINLFQLAYPKTNMKINLCLMWLFCAVAVRLFLPVVIIEAKVIGVPADTPEERSEDSGYVDTTEDVTEIGVRADTSHEQRDSRVYTHTTFEKQNTASTEYLTYKSDDKCTITIDHYITEYFQSQLLSKNPDVIQFKIVQLNNGASTTNSDVFKPLYWFWTFDDSSVPYPVVSWGPDYGLLSFHLLETNTIHVKDVHLNVSQSCNIRYGSNETTRLIVEALVNLIKINVTGSKFPVYPESNFCYYLAPHDQHHTFHYTVSQYLIFPIKSIEYMCSMVWWNYTDGTFIVNNQTVAAKLPGFRQWSELLIMPYYFGVIICLAFPVLLFRIAARVSKHEHVFGQYEMQREPYEDEDYNFDEFDNDWLFANGKSPLTLLDLLSLDLCGLGRRFPVAMSRAKRFMFILMAPMFIYMQSVMYLQGMGMWEDKDKITIDDLVRVGCPMGFLSLFSKAPLETKVFVPALGGPVGVAVLYYAIGTLFIALPRNLKQIVEDGLPNCNHSWESPVFLGCKTIISLSMIRVKRDQLSPGFTKASTLMKCRFFCLFTSLFWMKVWEIQTKRISFVWQQHPACKYVLCCCFLPVYITLCLGEIFCCIVYYGIPFCSFIAIIVRGATKALGYLGNQSRVMNYIFSYRISSIFVFPIFTVFAYIISLMFIKSFVFICQVITYCLVAVILYPSVSFGILFFFIVLVYYFTKLIRDFGDGYNELLTTAVEISRRLEEMENFIHIYNGQLSISNVKVERITDVRINGKQLDVSPNVLQTLKHNDVIKLKQRSSVYAIPKELFNIIVKIHRPIHCQVLSVCFKAALMIAFVATTLSIISNYVTGPSTEISEVMHVVFIGALGIVPKLVEEGFSHSNSVLVREIEERCIQNSIVEYWNSREY